MVSHIEIYHAIQILSTHLPDRSAVTVATLISDDEKDKANAVVALRNALRFIFENQTLTMVAINVNNLFALK